MPREPLVNSAFTYKKATGATVQGFIEKAFKKPIAAAKTREDREDKFAKDELKANIKKTAQKEEQRQASQAAAEQETAEKQKSSASLSASQRRRSSGTSGPISTYGTGRRVIGENNRVVKTPRRASSAGYTAPPSISGDN